MCIRDRSRPSSLFKVKMITFYVFQRWSSIQPSLPDIQYIDMLAFKICRYVSYKYVKVGANAHVERVERHESDIIKYHKLACWHEMSRLWELAAKYGLNISPLESSEVYIPQLCLRLSQTYTNHTLKKIFVKLHYLVL